MEVKKDRAYPPVNLKDTRGGTINFHPTESEVTEIDLSAGYIPKSQEAKSNGFWICPLETGTINVRLIGQKDTTRSLPIPIERVDVAIGQWMEEKCVEVLASGTTVSRALISWVGKI
jgi:hypothetical protein